ncbi:MAG TPA: 5-(carboxyamino)imidazole ribonucleotide synthase [Polyangiaceae bacterium]|nr:5-(carboxyamino)imidazole ribonucleotide synthase [Polyangiaceae bacterium]
MSPLLPGSTLGVLGGGQLARLLSLEARRMDYRVVVLDPDPACPAASVADACIAGRFDDASTLRDLARRADVVTLDTEHVPLSSLELLEREVPVRPGSAVLRVTQDRLAQRGFLRDAGLPQTAFAPVSDLASLEAALVVVGPDAVLKSRRQGYDGRGQVRIHPGDDLGAAWSRIGTDAVLEAFVPFRAELSVIVGRDASDRVETFPVVENVHEGHVLVTSVVPAKIPPEVERRAVRMAEAIARALGVVGVCGVELFLARDGALLVNEVAARTHNTGHYTCDATDVSQFEQQLRAICGLPLAAPRLLSPAVLVNLFGDLWEHGTPRWDRLLSIPGARLHLYGKREARPGRKMGHVVRLGDDAEPAALVSALRTMLGGSEPPGRTPADPAASARSNPTLNLEKGPS